MRGLLGEYGVILPQGAWRFPGAFIEDKNSGTILLQQALRRQMLTHPIDSKLTAMGKDERAISVSGCVHRELVKYTDREGVSPYASANVVTLTTPWRRITGDRLAVG